MSELDWTGFLGGVRKTIRKDAIPFVTRLSEFHHDDVNLRAFAILISTIISLRTKDKVTEEATFRILKLAATPQKMARLSVAKIEKAIYPCGFFRVKAQNIKALCQDMVKNRAGAVPTSIEELIRYPGVGRKTANLVLVEGFDEPAICVDIHVHRILNRIGFLNTKTPDDTEMVLRKTLPKRYWKKINAWLVTFGQYHCKPRAPLCEDCHYTQNCAYAQSHSHN